MLIVWDVVLYLGIIVFMIQMLKLNDIVTVLDSRCVLCRSNFISNFLVDKSHAVSRASLKIERRSGEIDNFP